MTDKQKTGIELIAEERRRQIEKYGWDAAHDDVLLNGELAIAAAANALPARKGDSAIGSLEHGWFRFGWFLAWQKEEGRADRRISDLARAGALIAAEIDRLQRASDGNPF